MFLFLLLPFFASILSFTEHFLSTTFINRMSDSDEDNFGPSDELHKFDASLYPNRPSFAELSRRNSIFMSPWLCGEIGKDGSASAPSKLL